MCLCPLGEAVRASRTDSDDALARQLLDLLRLPLVLPVAVAQRAVASITPAANGAAAGEGEAVVISSRHAHGAFAAQASRGDGSAC